MIPVEATCGNPDLRVKNLFRNGQQGIWYDPSDFRTMFQDSAGTTPVTAVGQPVGRILDKSGNGNHLLQSTTTRRPILRQDANGKFYLEHDGIDDYMNVAFGFSQPMTRVSVFKQISWTFPRYIFGAPTNSACVLFQNGTSPHASVNAGVAFLVNNLSVGTPLVLVEQYNGASSRARSNRNSYQTGNAGTNAVTGLTLCSNAGGLGNYGNIAHYGGVMVAGIPSDEQIESVVDYFALKGAVTL